MNVSNIWIFKAYLRKPKEAKMWTFEVFMFFCKKGLKPRFLETAFLQSKEVDLIRYLNSHSHMITHTRTRTPVRHLSSPVSPSKTLI